MAWLRHCDGDTRGNPVPRAERIMLGAVVAFQLMKWLHPDTVAGDTWAGMAALAVSLILFR